jgi:hypothetical protein
VTESPESAGLGREELDRVIRRASELQFEGRKEEPGDRISEAEVVRIGREVGLEPHHVRRALGELRAETLLPARTGTEGVWTRLVGDAYVSTSRVVRGDPATLTKALEEYLEIGESLHQVRKRGGRSRWEAAEGMMASLQRGMRWGGRRYELARARAVELSLEAVDDDHTLVALQADLTSTRREAGWGWILGFGMGGAGAGVGLGVLVAGPVLVAPIGAVAGVGIGVMSARRDFAGRVERIRLSLEGILDRLEAGEPLLGQGPSWRDRWLQ